MREYKYDNNVYDKDLEDLLNKRTEEGWNLYEVFKNRETFGVLFERYEKPLLKEDLMSEYDVLTTYMKYSDEEAKAFIQKEKMQKLEELKLEVLAKNSCRGCGIMVSMDGNYGEAPGC